ncbi:MAG: hypothetical protein AB7O68_14810 [Pirellulales bacterium]
MHLAHQTFAARPTFCSLADIFALLDEIDARDRNFMLGPLYQQVFRTTSVKIAPGMTEDDAMLAVYDRFKEQINSFVATVPSALLVTGIVTTTLVWLHGSSDESLIDDFIESNQRDLQTHQERLESGEITEQQFDRRRGEIEERLNNLRSDMALRRAHYEQFCEKVVARIVERR